MLLTLILMSVRYGYMIDNIILLITGTLHQRQIGELRDKCHPLGSFEEMESVNIASTPAELYEAVLVDTPIGMFHTLSHSRRTSYHRIECRFYIKNPWVPCSLKSHFWSYVLQSIALLFYILFASLFSASVSKAQALGCWNTQYTIWTWFKFTFIKSTTSFKHDANCLLLSNFTFTAAYFKSCISQTDLDELHIEIIRNALYKVSDSSSHNYASVCACVQRAYGT